MFPCTTKVLFADFALRAINLHATPTADSVDPPQTQQNHS
jgi:hypothetical protein